jgi:aarF domain-containing kinase
LIQQVEAKIDHETIRAPSEDTIEGTIIHDADAVQISNTTVPSNPPDVPEVAETNHRLKEGQAVPSTRVGRAVGFASLGFGLVAGTAVEAASRLLGSSSSSSVVASDANATRLALALCRMRGAALKLGQMLSIQDESLLPPALSKALTQVRQGADAMPSYQLNQQLEREWGMDWASKLSNMEETPFAAASIGQVHRATTLDQRSVVVKVQYPGVANSIESDLRNLSMLVKLSGLAPKGLFIDEVIRVGREELKEECNYLQEAKNQLKFKELVENDEVLQQNKFRVPGVAEELSTAQILVTDYAPGGTIDKVAQYGSQEERNRIGRQILRLTIMELFVWRFMQTDPNWGNFLHDMGTGTTYLIDFGAARLFDKKFVDGYLRIVWASANRDAPTLMDQSHKMKFLTGQENDIMLEAHKMSGFTVGEPFATNDPFDFRGSNISTRLSEHSSAFLQHRLT